MEIQSPIGAYERETGPEVHQGQDCGLAGIGRDRLHCDIERFSEWLIAVLEPQLRSDFGGTQLETHLLCAPVDLRVGRSIRFHAKLCSRQNNELHLLWRARVEERRLARAQPPTAFSVSVRP